MTVKSILAPSGFILLIVPGGDAYVVVPTSVFWRWNFFLNAPFPDHCLLVPFHINELWLFHFKDMSV